METLKRAEGYKPLAMYNNCALFIFLVPELMPDIALIEVPETSTELNLRLKIFVTIIYTNLSKFENVFPQTDLTLDSLKVLVFLFASCLDQDFKTQGLLDPSSQNFWTPPSRIWVQVEF